MHQQPHISFLDSPLDLILPGRQRRSSHQHGLSPPSPPTDAQSWPPKSKDNWMEVMVVADGPMVKYHGNKLRQYILTLMNIVSAFTF